MFESLADRLQDVFKRLRGKGRLTERDVDEALREVQRALLEADVSFKVVKGFVARIREKAVGEEVLSSLTPGQHVIKLVHDELVETLGDPGRIDLSGQPPHVVMMIGLQGAGKTTTVAKLAVHLRKNGQRPLLVAADVKRPAAIQQLITLGKQIDVPVFSEPNRSPIDICSDSLKRAREVAATVVLLDTAGRLHIDDELMNELTKIKDRTKPVETLLVADAMTGQDAVRAAGEFHQRVGLTGLILTKVDGDARGGAALSVRHVTGVPIKYLGVGEKLDALELYHPDRLASRILGMGDVLTLIEKAQAEFDEAQREKLEKKLRTATFDLDDFLGQMQQIKRMGPLTEIMKLIPGMGGMMKQLPAGAFSDDQFKHIEAIILSMTKEERRNPDIIGGSRKRRIALGSGRTQQEVGQLISQFRQMQKMLKQASSGKGMFGGLMGGDGKGGKAAKKGKHGKHGKSGKGNLLAFPGKGGPPSFPGMPRF